MVGSRSEHAGIIKDGAKLVNAVANSVVPKITIITGNSFGAGNYAMCGKAYDPRFIYAWPSAKIAVMGGEQAAGVLTTVKEEQLKAAGKEFAEAEKEALRQSILKKYETEGAAYYSTARLWDDGIIDPVNTRTVIALGIAVSLNKKWEETKNGVFRM